LLALKGRRFDTTDDITRALFNALAYWDAHERLYHWKRPQLVDGRVKGTYQILGLANQSEGLIEVAGYVTQLPDAGPVKIRYTSPLYDNMPQ
jgi:hypothetical protein